MNKKFYIVAYYSSTDPEAKVKYCTTLSLSAQQAIAEAKEKDPEANICMVAVEVPADEWQ